MAQFGMINRPCVLARGKLSPSGNEAVGNVTAPTSGQTITLFDSTLNGNGLQPIPGLPFSRIQVNINSSADSAASGVVFSSDFDGGNAAAPSSTNWRTQSSQSYTTASGPTSFDYLMKGSHVKVTYQNSAATLTAWEVEVIGIAGDRNPGS